MYLSDITITTQATFCKCKPVETCCGSNRKTLNNFQSIANMSKLAAKATENRYVLLYAAYKCNKL